MTRTSANLAGRRGTSPDRMQSLILSHTISAVDSLSITGDKYSIRMETLDREPDVLTPWSPDR